MHLHILGICGTFMGGVAALARESGHRVTGCDANVYPPMSGQLRALGIELIDGYDAGQLDLRPDVWVVGNVVSRGNPLMEAILDAGEPYVSGPQWLAEHVLRGRTVLAVAGTHGKTTTASMLASVLHAAGREPGFLIGGVPQEFDVSARLGADGGPFVIEADEYDTAFFDKRSKFVHYRPRVALLNNLEFDHADIFDDLRAIETQFHHLVRTVPARGCVIWNAAQPSLQRVIARGLWSGSERLDVADGWNVGDVVETADATRFAIRRGANVLAHCALPLSGAHNRANALGAIVAARAVGVEVPVAADALSRFRGVRRRMQQRGSVRGVVVLDDFAHHPTAVATTVQGLRERLRAGRSGSDEPRILAVIEPRSNTMKLGVMKQQLAASLDGADRIWCHCGGLDWDAADALAPLGARATVRDDIDALVADIAREARAGDHVLVMSNGGFGGIHERLLAALAQTA